MATTATTEQHSGPKVFPPFNPQTFASQLVWLAITFVILYALMAKVALPRVRSIIDNRERRIADDVAEAQNLKGQADAAIAAYEKALADARNRAQGIASEMRDKQNAESEARRKSVENDLGAKLAQAEKTIAATKQAAMANVGSIARDAASTIVERLLGKSPDPAEVEAAVAGALKR